MLGIARMHELILAGQTRGPGAQVASTPAIYPVVDDCHTA